MAVMSASQIHLVSQRAGLKEPQRWRDSRKVGLMAPRRRRDVDLAESWASLMMLVLYLVGLMAEL